MSYDISLLDPVSREVIQFETPHLMTGGMFKANYDESTGSFSPAPTTEAWLNITYNYSPYYYEVTNELVNQDGDTVGGIRLIYGMTGFDSISFLKKMINDILSKYKVGGDWVVSHRTKDVYLDVNTGKELDPYDCILHKKENVDYVKKTVEYDISEGPNENYWESTAGNAISPLYKLIAMAQLRPDGVWSGD